MRLHRIFLALVIGSLLQICAKAQGSFPASNRDAINNLTQTMEEFSMDEGEARTVAPPMVESSAAATARAEAVVLRPALTPLVLNETAATDKDTYMDVFNILKEDNSCSRFFGGSLQAVEAFNAFISRLQKNPLANAFIGVRMGGNFTRFHNRQTGARYRLFDEAAINSEGPFFQMPTQSLQPPLIGSFHAHTRQARALILLHELGHLVYDRGGQLVLPNDGDDLRLSLLNTRTVENQCINELLALGEGLDAEVFGNSHIVKRKR